MRRLPRIMLNAATVVSLVLCVATVALWVRSYWRLELLSRYRTTLDERFIWNSDWDIWVHGGGVRVDRARRRTFISVAQRTMTDFDAYATPRTQYGRGVFGDQARPWEYPRVAGEPERPPDEALDGGHQRRWTLLGFKWATGYLDGAQKRFLSREWQTWTNVVFPLWFVAALTAVLPALRLRSSWRRRRLRRAPAARQCPACGYDLRATPERCPECGTIPAR